MNHKVCIRSFWAPDACATRVGPCTPVGAQKLRMHTLRPTTCSTVDSMAREGAGDISGNDPGQGITSSSTYTHVQGAYGAPTGAVGGAADGTRRGAEAP